ncbi:hypothetical protein ADK35_16805 [Streptomyces viridochromogenes]|nr:hypothetical protein ADK35_16805 [Streptomyces viridochromogenes]KOG22916.1 hypothetical protein ADK36_10500 [Streptomyces viridochromogenes]
MSSLSLPQFAQCLLQPCGLRLLGRSGHDRHASAVVVLLVLDPYRGSGRVVIIGTAAQYGMTLLLLRKRPGTGLSRPR